MSNFDEKIKFELEKAFCPMYNTDNIISMKEHNKAITKSLKEIKQAIKSEINDYEMAVIIDRTYTKWTKDKQGFPVAPYTLMAMAIHQHFITKLGLEE